MSRGKHANVALFIPHNGCPHQCSFCDQKSITGHAEQPGAAEVKAAADEALHNLGGAASSAEIAFFGGSFTAIEQSYMLELLDAAAPYVKQGQFAGIRVSTRPDAISPEILKLLCSRGVTAVELGAQSMDNAVLQKNERGHTAEDVVNASHLIRQSGISLGLQMMTGLYGATEQSDEETAKALLALQPDTVRIYPTLVMRGTRLAFLLEQGRYRPQTLSDAVQLCTRLLEMFEAHGVPVIRLGLHDTPQLRQNLVDGPWHPAFRELCESRRMLIYATALLRGYPPGKGVLYVNPTDISKMVGQKKMNCVQLAQLGYQMRVMGDPSLKKQEIKVEMCR